MYLYVTEGIIRSMSDLIETNLPASRQDTEAPCTVILAGGNSRRMGNQDKTTLNLNGQSLTKHVINRIASQSAHIVISINGDVERFSKANLGEAYPCINDTFHPPRGPLGGVLAAMEYMEIHFPENKWLLSTPADCPFLPCNLGEALMSNIKQKNSMAAYASFKGKHHYLCALWSVSLLAHIKQHLRGENYSVRHLLKSVPHTVCEFKNEVLDPFFNINTLEDLVYAKEFLHTSSFHT